MFERKTSVLFPDTTEFSTVAIALEISPNNLYCLIFSKLSSSDESLRLFATYQLPAEALSTDSFV